MKKNIFVSGITLMTMLLAVGCSNNASQSNTNKLKVLRRAIKRATKLKNI